MAYNPIVEDEDLHHVRLVKEEGKLYLSIEGLARRLEGEREGDATGSGEGELQRILSDATLIPHITHLILTHTLPHLLLLPRPASLARRASTPPPSTTSHSHKGRQPSTSSSVGLGRIEVNGMMGELVADWEAVGKVLERLEGVRRVEVGCAAGLGNTVWEALATAPNLESLSLTTPALHPAHDILSLPVVPRYTPTFTSRDLADSREEEEPGMGMGMGMRAFVGLEQLRVEHLSAVGTRNLLLHLQTLANARQAPPLRSLHIATNFLDQPLCAAIASLGIHGKLEELVISTGGSKLCDAGIEELMGGLEGLRVFGMRDVQGRLTKNLWKDVEEWPESLEELRIEINEIGSHHSWSFDHHESLHRIPFPQLTTFSVLRKVPLLALLPFALPPPGVHVPEPEHGCVAKPLPEALLEVLSNGSAKDLKELCLDWWEVDEEAVVKIVKGCPGLEVLRLRICFGIEKLISMTCFTSAPHLRELVLSVSPGKALVVEFKGDSTGSNGRGGKSKSTSNKAKSTPSDEIDDPLDESLHGLSPWLREKIAESDVSIPALKDIKKFIRKVPLLETIEWTGRGGKGTWFITRSSDDKKNAANVRFEHSGTRYGDLWMMGQEAPPVWNFPDIVDQISDAADIDSVHGSLPNWTSTGCPAMSSTASTDSEISFSPPGVPLARWKSSTSNGGKLASHDEEEDGLGMGGIGMGRRFSAMRLEDVEGPKGGKEGKTSKTRHSFSDPSSKNFPPLKQSNAGTQNPPLVATGFNQPGKTNGHKSPTSGTSTPRANGQSTSPESTLPPDAPFSNGMRGDKRTRGGRGRGGKVKNQARGGAPPFPVPTAAVSISAPITIPGSGGRPPAAATSISSKPDSKIGMEEGWTTVANLKRSLGSNESVPTIKPGSKGQNGSGKTAGSAARARRS